MIVKIEFKDETFSYIDGVSHISKTKNGYTVTLKNNDVQSMDVVDAERIMVYSDNGVRLR